MISAEQQVEKYIGFPVVPEKPKTKIDRNMPASYVIVIALVLALTGILYTYEKTRVITLGYQVNRTRQSVLELERRNRLLEYKLAQLQSLGRVEKIARLKLGMTEAEVVLPDDEVLNKGPR